MECVKGFVSPLDLIKNPNWSIGFWKRNRTSSWKESSYPIKIEEDSAISKSAGTPHSFDTWLAPDKFPFSLLISNPKLSSTATSSFQCKLTRSIVEV